MFRSESGLLASVIAEDALDETGLTLIAVFALRILVLPALLIWCARAILPKKAYEFDRNERFRRTRCLSRPMSFADVFRVQRG